jgi:hypothetical protein
MSLAFYPVHDITLGICALETVLPVELYPVSTGCLRITQEDHFGMVKGHNQFFL